jgi:hypothetical protein
MSRISWKLVLLHTIYKETEGGKKVKEKEEELQALLNQNLKNLTKTGCKRIKKLKQELSGNSKKDG